MKQEIETIQADALAAIAAAGDEKSLDDARVAFLGKKGKLTAASAGMRHLSNEEKPVIAERNLQYIFQSEALFCRHHPYR